MGVRVGEMIGLNLDLMCKQLIEVLRVVCDSLHHRTLFWEMSGQGFLLLMLNPKITRDE